MAPCAVRVRKLSMVVYITTPRTITSRELLTSIVVFRSRALYVFIYLLFSVSIWRIMPSMCCAAGCVNHTGHAFMLPGNPQRTKAWKTTVRRDIIVSQRNTASCVNFSLRKAISFRNGCCFCRMDSLSYVTLRCTKSNKILFRSPFAGIVSALRFCL